MRFIILILSAILIISCSQNEETTVENSEIVRTDTGYDEQLAAEVGADDYGMKQYVMAFLKRGPNRSSDSTTAANLQREHLANIDRLANEGKLVLAGPFLDDGDLRGIYVFNVTTVEEAKALTETDPAIQAGSLVMELRPWYGSAAMMKITELHYKIAKENP